MSIQDLKDLILRWIPDNDRRLISPERVRNAYYDIIDFFRDIIGDKSELETTDKSSLVNAINELKQEVGVAGEDGKDGLTPTIGENGNWWIGEQDTGVSAMPKSLQIRYDSEISGLRDGINKTFTVDDAYRTGTLKVYFNGILLSKGNNADFIEVNAGTSGNGAVINRVITSKDKLIFEFEKWD